MITILFKLIPFVIGVDEAGAQFVGETVALAAGIGVTMAVIRKGRVIFWTLIGLLIIAKRGLSIRDLSEPIGRLSLDRSKVIEVLLGRIPKMTFRFQHFQGGLILSYGKR